MALKNTAPLAGLTASAANVSIAAPVLDWNGDVRAIRSKRCSTADPARHMHSAATPKSATSRLLGELEFAKAGLVGLERTLTLRADWPRPWYDTSRLKIRP
jgi:hypothetical protein